MSVVVFGYPFELIRLPSGLLGWSFVVAAPAKTFRVVLAFGVAATLHAI